MIVKKDNISEKPLLGRPGNNLKMGIVGFPNVGKSSFFNALTNSSVQAENFPFCTLQPSKARVLVSDPRFDFICELYKPASKVPAFLTVVDIAGLVKGAAEGEGLGNEFLSNINAVDGIFHLMRAFKDPEIAHVEGDVDPVRDMEIIHEELRKKDVQYLKNIINSREKDVVRLGRGGTSADKAKKEEFEIIKKIADSVIKDNKDVRQGSWNNKEIDMLNTMYLLTSKPVVYLCNISEGDYVKGKNRWLRSIKTWIDNNYPGDILIPYSGILEKALSENESPSEKEEYLKSLKEKYNSPTEVASALNKIVVSGYKTLDLIYFFTAGPDEVRAWTIRKNTKTPAAAGTIHTDFEKAFIMADIMKYDDLKEHGTETKVKAAGKYHQKGKDYVVCDGDIIYVKAGQVNPPKKR